MEETGSVENHYDMFLSYEAANRDLCAKLSSSLKELGYRVWIDLENNNEGDRYEAIAEGIEKSECVLVCVSEKYSQNESCKKVRYQE